MFTVALIGPDGAGKSTIAKRLPDVLPFPMTSIYMGINLESSTLMLPTTRLLLALRRSRSGNVEPLAARGREPVASASSVLARVRRSTRSALRIANWVGEQGLRQTFAWFHRRRGTVVVFDRHFFPDYYADDIATTEPGRPLSRRIHGFLLAHAYPKPDLTVVLDAPGEVLFARKSEASPEWLELRRHDYLEMTAVLPRVTVVDATRPLADVVDDVADIISTFYRERVTADGHR